MSAFEPVNTHLPAPSYPLLDVMRAMAALLVLVYHVIAVTGWHFFPDAWWAAPLREGWIGVDMFLVISGFVITLSAARDFQANPSNFRRGFMARRIWRVAPLYLATSLVFLFFVQPQLLTVGAKYLVVQGVTHLLFIHNLHHSTHGAINGPTWSIGLEMQFYVLVIASIPWLIRLRPWKVVVACVLIAWAYRYGTTVLWPPGTTPPIIQMIYATQLPGTLDNFVMGIALALVKIHSPGHRLLAQNARVFSIWLFVALLMSVLWWVVFWPKKYYWIYPDMIVFWRTLLAVASGAWLVVFITCPRQSHWLTAPFRYLGRISYGIYLWHMPLLLALKNVLGTNQPMLLAWVLAATLLMSALSWHAFEQRLSKLGRFRL